jgi:hypothetical protein
MESLSILLLSPQKETRCCSLPFEKDSDMRAKKIYEDREIMDLVERNYDAWELDQQFDRQPVCVASKEDRIEAIAAVYWFGNKYKVEVVSLTAGTLEFCVLWSDVLKSPVILQCARS